MINNIKNKKGFALLYAIFVSAMILAISVGITTISYKEIVFSTSAKDANDAFYAADSAAECALYFDKADIHVNPYNLGSDHITCNGTDATLTTAQEPLPSDLIHSSFTVVGLGSSAKACAKVTVTKHYLSGSDTRITSVGYNDGTNGIDCFPTLTSVQRVLELNY